MSYNNFLDQSFYSFCDLLSHEINKRIRGNQNFFETYKAIKIEKTREYFEITILISDYRDECEFTYRVRPRDRNFIATTVQPFGEITLDDFNWDDKVSFNFTNAEKLAKVVVEGSFTF